MRTDWTALHVLKFLAVTVMICLHSFVWLVSWEDAAVDPSNPLFHSLHQMAWLPWLLFLPLCIPMTAGAAFHLQTEEARLKPGGLSFPTLIRTAIFLAVLSLLMNAISWGLEDLEWDVLQFVGLCYLASAFCLRAGGTKALYLAGALSLFLTPFMRSLFPMNDNRWAGILVGTQSPHVFWPFFPWFFTFLFGFLISHAKRHFSPSAYLLRFLLPVAAICLLIGAFSQELWFDMETENLWGPRVFQPSIPAVVGLSGYFALLMLICEWSFAHVRLNPNGLIKPFSSGILWIYLIHTCVGVHLSKWMRLSFSLEKSLFLLPMTLLVLSWGVGRLLSWLSAKQIRIRVTKVAP
jgi:hypothetical protein